MYDGDWKDNNMCGKGKLFLLDSLNKEYVCVYTGEWASNQRNGFGTNNYSSGSVYEGEWKNDMRHGHGKMVYENGDIYEGQWYQDAPHSRGSMSYADQTMYIGLWVNGRRCGEGCYESSDGVYCGSWKNDMKNGPGRYTYPSGNVLNGIWMNDVFRCGTLVEGKPEKLPVCTLVNSDEVVEQASKFFLKQIDEITLFDDDIPKLHFR